MFTGISFSTFPCVSFLFFRLVRRCLCPFLFCPDRAMRQAFHRPEPFLSMPLFYTPSIYNSIFYSGQRPLAQSLPSKFFLKDICTFYLPAPAGFSAQTPRPPVFLSDFLCPLPFIYFSLYKRNPPMPVRLMHLRFPAGRLNAFSEILSPQAAPRDLSTTFSDAAGILRRIHR